MFRLLQDLQYCGPGIGGEEDTRKFEELEHILQLCFDHRKKLLDNYADFLIKKLLFGKIAKGEQIFVDITKYGFEFRPIQ